MTANSTTTSPACPTTSGECADLNASLRWPVLSLFFGAAFWLIVSSLCALIASIKCHAPGIFADCEWFAYGRLHAVHLNALVYGFAAQGALGVTLALLARTGQTRLALPGGALFAAKLWNLGVLVGVVSIFAGHNTGIQFLEFSQAGAVILFIAYLILALAGLLTFAKRNVCSDVSQSFLVTALFWFPWIYATATALLGCMPVRGVTQAVIAWWFTNNFLFVWLGLIALGALFHFAPQYAGRPLYSRQLALFALLVLIGFASWSGVPAGAPVPAWIPALSTFGAIVTLTAVVAVVVNLKHTMAGCRKQDCDAAGNFFCKSVPGFIVYGVGSAVASISGFAHVLDFTWFSAALNYFLLYGFVAMVLLGAIYRLSPQLIGVDYCCVKPVKIHFWFALLGTLFLAGSLALAGIRQGRLLNDTAVDFNAVSKGTQMFFRMSTVGDLLILLGALTLAFNFAGLLWGMCKQCCGKTSEVKQ